MKFEEELDPEEFSIYKETVDNSYELVYSNPVFFVTCTSASPRLKMSIVSDMDNFYRDIGEDEKSDFLGTIYKSLKLFSLYTNEY